MKLITFLFSTLTIIGLGQGLKCYSCFWEGCSDPFNATATGVSNVTCVSGFNYCAKQAVTIDSANTVFRGCVNSTSMPVTRRIGSVTNRLDITYGKLYTCDTDFCNGASSMKNAIGVAIVSLVGLAYITL
ncbi:uncharacterized protein LOC107265422 [Cephus cinctus]|uniref:Uncharacterized protein LOC107265422 n=1 Tax=Cephus cinctus TaxID=211228 RepID=A0AAJ7BN98_CEPCN|nr:uncharacterized protein LOC107265422 [Cephus cinctus]